MSGIKDLIHSTGYRTFMKTLLRYALIVFGLGIIFLLCKLPGGKVIIMTGGSTLFFWMLLFIIGKLVENNS
jgi:hypothetical protein